MLLWQIFFCHASLLHYFLATRCVRNKVCMNFRSFGVTFATPMQGSVYVGVCCERMEKGSAKENVSSLSLMPEGIK